MDETIRIVLQRGGLSLNLIGAFLLGLHIFGLDRLKKVEKHLRALPKQVSYRTLSLLGRLFLAFFIRSRKYEWRNIDKDIAGLLSSPNKRIIEAGISGLGKVSLHPDIPLTRVLLASGLKAILIWFPIHLFVKALTVPFSLSVKTVATVQDKLGITSLLGLLGVFMLILGYVLQMIATF